MRHFTALLMAIISLVTLPARPADYFIARRHIADGQNIPYRLFIPDGYSAAQDYPVVLTLHGGGGNGTDNWYHITYDNNVAEAWAEPDRQAVNPAFVVAPQIPSGDSWGDYNVWNIDLLDSLLREFSIDPARQYVCGISLGGFGTYGLAKRYPHRFAAIVPMSSGGGDYDGKDIMHLSIWNFHSQNDDVVPVSTSRAQIASIEKNNVFFVYTHCGRDGSCTSPLPAATLDSLVKAGERRFYTEFCCSGHACQDAAFAIPSLFTWTFLQRVDSLPPGDPANLRRGTITPSSISLSWDTPAAAADGDTAARYKVFRDGMEIATVFSPSYTDIGLAQDRTYRYDVYAADFAGNLSSGRVAGGYTTADNGNGPEVAQVVSYGPRLTEVVFDKPVAAGGKFDLSGGIAVSGTERGSDARSVIITTDVLTVGTEYAITINGVTDTTAAKNPVDVNTVAVFTALEAFTDDFEDGDFGDWTPGVSPYWGVVDDQGDKSLYITDASNAQPLVLDRFYRTVTVDAQVSAYSGSQNRNVTVWFGYTDEDNCWYVNLAGINDDKHNGIFRKRNGYLTKLAENTVPLLPDRKTYHEIRVTADPSGGTITCWADDSGTPVLTASDLNYTGGRIAIGSDEQKIWFDDISVSRTNDTPFAGIGRERTGHAVSRLRISMPNPVGAVLEMDAVSGLREGTVFDRQGNAVAHLERLENGKWRCDLQCCPAGLYILQLNAGGDIRTFIKPR